MNDRLGISKLVAVPDIEILRALVDGAVAVRQHVRFDRLPDGLTTGLLDLRFSTNRFITHEADFLGLSVFGTSMEAGRAIPREIILNPMQPDVALTYIHELGHCVDYYGSLPVCEFCSGIHEQFFEWRTAVGFSEAFDRLWWASTQEEIEIEDESGAVETVPVPQDRLRSLRKWHEYWARAFTQYVVTKSGSNLLRRMLEDRRAEPRNAVYPLVWTPEDFKPIAKEVEKVLGNLPITTQGGETDD